MAAFGLDCGVAAKTHGCRMTTREVAASSSGVRGDWVPWGTIADLGGLAVATSVAVVEVGLRHTGVFIYVLAASGLLTWLMLRQLGLGLPGLVRPGYRYVFAPVLAALVSVALLALLRDYYSRAALLAFVASWTLWIAAGRYSLRRLAPPVQVLCVGDRELVQELSDQPWLEVTIIGRPQLEFRKADLVVVDAPLLRGPSWLDWILHMEMTGVPIMSSQRAREALTGRLPIEHIDERWARDALHERSTYETWKRLLDVVVVVVASPLVLFLLIAVGAAVFVDSGGPVIFKQDRVGRNGRTFRILKFRTMHHDAELNGAAFATQGDARVTRLGRVLRQYRLDEIPQFWNVLRGDMSIIGPRPEQVGFVREFQGDIPLYELRHSVRPGITGWAQVSHGYAASADESAVKLSYDLYYIKNCSLLLDAIVVFRTARIVLSGFGAR